MDSIYNIIIKIYPLLFENFIDINFFIRIVGFIIAVVIANILLELAIMPLLILVFGPLILRGWNFCVTETLSELLYIKFLSDPSKKQGKFIKGWYNRLNTKIESHYEYFNNERTGLDFRGKVVSYRKIINRRAQERIMSVITVASILFVIIFIISTFVYDFKYKPTIDETVITTEAATTEPQNETTTSIETITYSLTAAGKKGANVRTLPNATNSQVLEVVKGDDVLIYMGETLADQNDSNRNWYKVKTPNDVVGWISSALVIQN